MFIESTLILLFIFDIALIVLIYSYNPAAPTNRFLSLLLIPITLTNLTILFLHSAQENLPVRIGLNIAIWSVIFFFPLFYHFSFYFPRKSIQKNTLPKLLVFYITPIIIGVLNLISVGFEPDIRFFNRIFALTSAAHAESGLYLYHFLMLIYILILLTLTTRRLIRSLKLPILKKERQTIFLILTGFIPLSFILLFNYLLFYPLGWGIYLYLIASTTYTVFFLFLLLQFGYIERKSLVRVFIIYPLVIGGLLLLFQFFLSDFNELLIDLFNINNAFLMSVEILVFFAVLSPLIRSLENLLGSSMFPIRTNFHEALRDASIELVHIINLYDLDKFLSKLFLGELKLTHFFFLAKDDQSHRFQTLKHAPSKYKPEFSEYGELVVKLKKEKKILDIQQLSLSWSGGKELRILDYFKITIVVPLVEKNDLVGILLLGEPGVAQTWHFPEIEALELFASGLSITIARCKMHRHALDIEKRQSNLEKLAVLSELSSGVAHEIRNPMSIIATSAETIVNKELSPEETKKIAGYIQEETKRMSYLLNKILLSFSPQTDLNNASTDVCEVISHTFNLVGSQARKKNLRLVCNCKANESKAYIDWAALTQVCLNIILNAIEATPQNGTIEARIKNKSDTVQIRFINDGEVIPESIRQQIFNPFFTTKENGTGLGLPVSKRLIQEAGGQLRILPSKEKTIFQITLPRVVFNHNEQDTEKNGLRTANTAGNRFDLKSLWKKSSS